MSLVERAAGVPAADVDSWQRQHLQGRIRAFAIWLNGRCEASVYGRSGRPKSARRVRCGTTAKARRRADALLREAFPHDCDRERCGPWLPFVRIAL
jgi:hypothetical protein